MTDKKETDMAPVPPKDGAKMFGNTVGSVGTVRLGGDGAYVAKHDDRMAGVAEVLGRIHRKRLVGLLRFLKNEEY